MNKSRIYFYIAHIQVLDSGHITVPLSKNMEIEPYMERKKAHKLHAIYLLNLTTNILIWRALNSQLVVINSTIVKSHINSFLNHDSDGSQRENIKSEVM